MGSIQDAAYLEKWLKIIFNILSRTKTEKPHFIANNKLKVIEIESDEYNFKDEFIFNPLGKGVVKILIGKNLDKWKIQFNS